MAAVVGTQMRAPNGGSRLAMMQARLREQLMLEKESRLLEMAARQDAEREDIISRVTKTSASSLSSSMSSLSSSGAGQGRVRKMFEDRRHNGGNRGYHQSPKGIDKSNPLEPVRRAPPPKGVVRNNRNASVDRSSFGYAESMTRSRSQVNMQRANRGDTRIQRPPKGPSVGRSVSHHKSTSSLMDNSYYNGSSRGPSPGPPSSTKSSPGPRGPPSIPVAPARRNKPPTKNTSNQLKVNGHRTSKSRSRSPSPAPSPRNENKGFFAKLGFGKKAEPKKPPQRSARQPPASSRPNRLGVSRENKAPPSANTPRKIDPSLKECKICNRGFAPDRIQKHEQICAKSKQKQKKRKPFDPVKMRTNGTDAEKFVARGDHLKEDKKSLQIKAKKNNWRKKHDDFIATVRAAKGVKGYVAPPIDTSDYVVCPHCGRKFSDKVADRHIPKCASITSNKGNRLR